MGIHEGGENTFWRHCRSTATKAARLIFATTLWLHGITKIIYCKGLGLRERAELLVGIVILAGVVLLPFFGGLLLKTETHDPQVILFLFSAFVISLMPAVIFLCLIGVVLVVPH